MKQFTIKLSSKVMLLFLALLSIGTVVNQAQPIDFSTPKIYYIANDENGIHQVFQMSLDEAQEILQLSYAENDVISFGISYDTLSIAYFSNGQLWLKSLSNAQVAESLVTIDIDEYLRRPVFSPDNRYIAYADQGVWLLDLTTREMQQLIQDVPLASDGSNAGEYAIYAPDKFIRGVDGTMSHLVVVVGLFEWHTAGIYDLHTHELQIVDEVKYTDLLPLYGGRILMYGNNQLDGLPKLYVATGVNDISNYNEVFDFSNLIDGAILFAHRALEIAPGTVRIVGTTMEGENLETTRGFYFDYNLMANELVGVNSFELPVSESSERLIGMMSPEGNLLSILVEIAWNETQQLFGNTEIFDLSSGQTLFSIPQVSELQWRP